MQYVRGTAIASRHAICNGADGIDMDAQKDLPVDMGENYPYLGPYDRKV